MCLHVRTSHLIFLEKSLPGPVPARLIGSRLPLENLRGNQGFACITGTKHTYFFSDCQATFLGYCVKEYASRQVRRLTRLCCFAIIHSAMTDIRQHLPLILTALRQHMDQAATPEILRTHLRALLPASYGLGTGQLMNASGQISPPLDIIIYDTTFSAAQIVPEPYYDIRQALVVLVFAQEIETEALKRLLHTIASVKLLRPHLPSEQAQPASKPSRQKQQKSPLKRLLPLGIVAFQHLPDISDDAPESSALLLDALLKEQPGDLRPDYLLTRTLLYQNPFLRGEPFMPGTMSIAREPILSKPRPCYVCKQMFSYTHFFYPSLCLRCGDFNYQKRGIPGNFTGRTALVTGARVKIGYATALRLLRAGMSVIATTRFPHDAAVRYSNEPDFGEWRDRLHIYGLDFRYLPVLERFVTHLSATYPALDILINNAAQTVRRPLDYFAHLLPQEQAPLTTLTSVQQALVERSHACLPPTPFAIFDKGTPPSLVDAATGQHTSAGLLHDYSVATGLPAVPGSMTSFPAGRYDEHLQQVDLRTHNSWTLLFDEISLTEFLEVQIINVTAPFLLVSRLYPLLKRSTFAQRFIINVSAVEGQFANPKLGSHLHTNMAKASLNMLTHTAAPQLARDQIFMNSVDPGWISRQSPLINARNQKKIQQLLPLDLVDAAARICDPIFLGITTGETAFGQLYKDYQKVAW